MIWELGSIYKTASKGYVRITEVNLETGLILAEGTKGLGAWDIVEGRPLTNVSHEYGSLMELQRPAALGVLKHG